MDKKQVCKHAIKLIDVIHEFVKAQMPDVTHTSMFLIEEDGRKYIDLAAFAGEDRVLSAHIGSYGDFMVDGEMVERGQE